MIFVVVSVFDSAVNNYSPPLAYRSIKQAIRQVSQEAKNPESKLSMSPLDFSLMHLGSFDDESGMMLPLAAPARIAGISELLKD